MMNMPIAAGNLFLGTFDVVNTLKNSLTATKFGMSLRLCSDRFAQILSWINLHLEIRIPHHGKGCYLREAEDCYSLAISLPLHSTEHLLGCSGNTLVWMR